MSRKTMHFLYHQPKVSARWLLILSTIYFTTVLNASFWRFMFIHMELTNAASVIFVLTLPFFLFSGLCLLFCLLFWPYSTKPLLIILLLVSSLANYFMFQYGIYINADMIRNVFETTFREAAETFGLNTVLWFLVTGLLPAAIVARCSISYQSPLRELQKRLKIILVCFLLLAIIAASSYKEYVTFGRNNQNERRLINPINYIYATVRYFQIQTQAKREFVPLAHNPSLEPYDDPAFTVFVLVLGEASRAQNFSLNGYNRPTNPKLQNEDVLFFKNVESCGTSTAISVPCMFSDRARRDFDVTEAKFTENLFDILLQTGYQVWWFENDDGCKGVCERVFSEIMNPNGNPKFCDGQSCVDDELLVRLEEYLEKITNDTVIVLHTRGSHGPSYFKRYPEKFKVFSPTCDTADLQNCSREAIINTYDNTIVYTDHIVSSAINILKKYNKFESGLLYVSDHGQSLGENNIYLHGLPFSIAPEQQTKVPLIMWLSENMRKYDYLNYQCLGEKAASSIFSHDNLFHSLLSLMEIKTELYDKNLDLFLPCRLNPTEK